MLVFAEARAKARALYSSGGNANLPVYNEIISAKPAKTRKKQLTSKSVPPFL